MAETLEAREEVREGLFAGTGGLGPRDDAYERCEARDSIESMDAFDMLNSWLQIITYNLKLITEN